jgi:putative ABC transport system ATP-binding protein
MKSESPNYEKEKTVSALRMEGVSKAYRAGAETVRALVDVDLDVAPGEIVVIVGPSGSGKSTLLAVAGVLLSPDAGTVRVAGTDVGAGLSKAGLTQLRREHIGFVFQGANLVPYLTAAENLRVVASSRSRRAIRADAAALLDAVGMAGRVGHLPAQLSGGERQRVAIARALMNRPELLLVDEPTSALDTDLGSHVMDLLVAQARDNGIGTVVVTHDPLVAKRGDRIAAMRDGRLHHRDLQPALPVWSFRPDLC